MPRPVDPLGAARSTPRDHQYRIERLEKRLALAEAQSASTVEMGWLDVGGSYNFVNGEAMPAGVCPYTIRPWGHTSYGTYYDGTLDRDCPDYSGIALFWPNYPVASALDDMRAYWVQGGPTFARFDLPPGVWSIDVTVWIEKNYYISDFYSDPAGTSQRFQLYLRPLSRWPGMDDGGVFQTDPGGRPWWDGTTYGAESRLLVWPGTIRPGPYFDGPGFNEQVDDSELLSGLDEPWWRWSVEGLDFVFSDDKRYRSGNNLSVSEYDTLHLHVVDSFPSGDTFHIHGEYTGWLNGEYSNVESATIEVLSWHVSATQVAAASTIPEAR